MERHLVVLREAGLDLHLPVDVVRQEGQPQHLEEQLQVGLPEREEVGGPATDVAVAAHAHLRGAERRLEVLLLGVAVTQAEVQHGAQRPGAVGREGPRVEVDLAHEVGVDDAHRTARGALRGEVVDVRNLDAVHVELVLRRAAAAHDEVVAVAHGREGDTRVGADDARDVAVGAGALLDLAHADHLHPHGHLDRGAEGGRPHRDGLKLRGILVDLDLDEGRRGRDEVFGREGRAVAHRRDLQARDARLHALDAEAPERVGRGAALLLPRDHHGGIGHRLARQAVNHPPADGIPRDALLRPKASSRTQQQRQQEGSDHPETAFHSSLLIVSILLPEPPRDAS